MAADCHTFVFTDLVGFTALTAAEGDERGADVAIELRDRVRPLLGLHRAEEVKAIGDGLMLRCARPASAIELGLGVVSTLSAVSGFPPVRVGMHSGPAVNRRGDWYGTTVNVAARLCQAAAGGEVLVSETTAGLAGSRAHLDVELEERRTHWLKNITEPIGVHVLRPPEPTPGSPRARRWSRPLKNLIRLPQGAC